MPVVVDELVIRVHVDNAAPSGAARSATPQEKQALIAEVVEHVLEILRRRQEP